MDKASQRFPANTSSGLPILGLGLVAIAAGFYHSAASAVALGLMLAAVPGVIYALLRMTSRGVIVHRSLPESVFEDEEIQVRLELTNRSRFPLFFPRLSETFGPEIHAYKNLLVADRVDPRESVVQTYVGKCSLPRGVYRIGPCTVSLSDPFGWFEIQKKFTRLSPLKVYPRLENFGVRERVGDTLSQLVTDITRFGIGSSQEFFSVREYTLGDSIRNVHWRLTARRGFPVVREFSRISAGDLTMVVDLYQLGLIGVGRSNSLEHAVKITAAVTSASLSRGFRVGLLVGGNEELDVEIGRGQAQLRRILDALVRVKAVGQVPLYEALGRLRSVRAGSTLLLPISPYLFGDPQLESRLRNLRANDVRIVAAVFDAGTFRYLSGHPGEHVTFGECLSRLRTIGVEVYRIPCAADLRRVFAEVTS